MDMKSYRYDGKFEGNSVWKNNLYTNSSKKQTIWPDKGCNLAYKNYLVLNREDNIR